MTQIKDIICCVQTTINLKLWHCWNNSILSLNIYRQGQSIMACCVVLVTVGIVIGTHVQVKKVFQLPLEGLKGGTVHLILLPAVHHDLVHHFGTVRWAGHPVPCGKPLDHLIVGHGCRTETMRDMSNTHPSRLGLR